MSPGEGSTRRCGTEFSDRQSPGGTTSGAWQLRVLNRWHRGRMCPSTSRVGRLRSVGLPYSPLPAPLIAGHALCRRSQWVMTKAALGDTWTPGCHHASLPHALPPANRLSSFSAITRGESVLREVTARFRVVSPIVADAVSR